MKISKLIVDGYKNLLNCEFELSDFNVLIGANNSGKSNLLEVFTILDHLIYGSDSSKRSIINGYTDEFGAIRSDCLGVYSNELLIEIEYSEDIGNDTYIYTYSVALEHERVEVTDDDQIDVLSGRITRESLKYKNIKSPGRANVVFERIENEVKKIPRQAIQKIDNKELVISLISKIKDINDKLEPEVQRGIELLLYICKTPIIYNSPNEVRESILGQKENIIRYGKIVALPLGEEISKIIRSKQKEVFLDVVSEVLDIKNLNVNEFSGIKFVNVTFDNGQEVTIQQLSDGTLIALSIITYLFSKKYPIIAIEELENSLHPKLLKKMIYLLKTEFADTQVIITTHSPVLLNLVQVNDVSIMTKNENGAASIYRVQDKKELVKKLNNPLSSFGDIFYLTME